MTWYLLILVYTAPLQPEMMGAWKSEAACHDWFDQAEKTGDVPDVIRHDCIPIETTIARTATARDPAQVRRFRKEHPCPVTGKTTGACVGWVVDHVWPLCADGLDTPSNMAWQEQRQSYIKDRLERDFCRCKKGTP